MYCKFRINVMNTTNNCNYKLYNSIYFYNTIVYFNQFLCKIA